MFTRLVAGNQMITNIYRLLFGKRKLPGIFIILYNIYNIFNNLRGTMPPPMSALITAKDANDDLVEVVLFEKFNDLRGFGRRLFLPFDQAGYYYLLSQCQ